MRHIGLASAFLIACGSSADVESNVELPVVEENDERDNGNAAEADLEHADPVEAPDVDEPTETERVLALPSETSRSRGGPNDGSLEGGVALPLEGPGFRFNPRRSVDARYGTVEMIHQLIRAAGVVEREMPGSELFINDLSLRNGGPIPHHGSHRAGRDVDVLFYLLDSEGEPREPVGAPLDRRGRGTDYRDLADPEDDLEVVIDLPRTWRFTRALIEGEPDTGAPLQRIFVVEHLRSRLLEHANSVGAPPAVRRRFEQLTCQPSYPHDDHFHFRFFCSPEDLAEGDCADSRPHYSWRESALRTLGLEMRLHRPRPDRPTAPITTAEQARAAAGPMHPDVRRFLRRRRAWMRQPHPGRPHCP